MRTLTDLTCKRCGCTESCMWVDHEDLAGSHVCPDGERSSQFIVTERVVPGPGERSKDDEIRR